MAKRTPNPIPADIAQYWHPELNEKQPTDYTAGSGFKAWWKCAQGHDFHATINDVTNGHGCSYCSGNKAWAGFNDLATLRPEIAKEWHATLNDGLLPSQITAGSKKKVWWTGECGHDFFANVNSRTASGNTGCPYCAGQKILVGFNDLATTNPDVAALWHATLNAATPQETTAGTNVKYWWTGECGHDFPCAVSEKVRTGNGCPYCSGKKVLAGFNDLASNHPEIAAEWSKTNDLGAHEVSHKSTSKFEWVCPVGHLYIKTVRARTSGGAECQYCKGQQRLIGFSDLGSTHPELGLEWDYVKNGDLKPEDFVKTSTQKVWWKCTEGHSYLTSPQSRTDSRNPAGCNVCSNRALHTGINDLATVRPIAVTEWHPVKNGDLKPDAILASYRQHVWWICQKGHQWSASPISRFSGGTTSGCPVCQSKNFSSAAEKEIASILENLGEEIVRNHRKLLKGSELDIYLPKRNMAVEYNGLYWHSMDKNGMHKNYHRDKWLACKNEGVQLVQIWEDDWKFKREIVLRTLLHKVGVLEKAVELLPELGLTVHPRVFARKTVVEKVSLQETRAFFEKNHLQGFASGSHYLGLKGKNGELVACMVLKKESGNTLNIIRYATDRTVVGGFTKLLVYAERNLPVDKFVTFSDHCISDGGLYENNGFVVDKELRPDYSYVVRARREHKFGYRLERFKRDPDLKWEEGMTESELASLNKISRLYDAGKSRWVKTVERHSD